MQGSGQRSDQGGQNKHAPVGEIDSAKRKTVDDNAKRYHYQQYDQVIRSIVFMQVHTLPYRKLSVLNKLL
jgi:hypothetical protein